MERSASALYSSPVGFFSKLRNIWEFTSQLISIAEKKHFKVLKKTWGLHAEEAFSAQSLLQKASLAAKNNILTSHHNNFLSTAYFSALMEIRAINCNFHSIENGKFVYPGRSIVTGVSDKEFLIKIINSEENKFQAFLDYVVIHFFPLQLYCLNLKQMLESAPGIPPDPIKRRQRAIAGALAKNHGEQELKTRVLNFIKIQNPDTKYLEIIDFVEDFEDDFCEILENYKSDVKAKKRTSGKELKYKGPDTFKGFERKIAQWKTDEEFKLHLERVCIIRSSKKY